MSWFGIVSLVLGLLVIPSFGYLLIRKYYVSWHNIHDGKNIEEAFHFTNDLPPAMAALILNTPFPSNRHAATLFDLAARGYIRIEQRGIHCPVGDLRIYKLKEIETNAFEKEMVEKLSSYDGKELKPTSISPYFTDKLNKLVETKAMELGFFRRRPSSSANQVILLFTIVVCLVPIAMFILLSIFSTDFNTYQFGWLPPLSLVVTGSVVFVLTGRGVGWRTMTETGTQIAIRCSSYYKNLEILLNSNKQNLKNTQNWDTYLAHSIILNKTRQWLKVFRSNMLPIPNWYSINNVCDVSVSQKTESSNQSDSEYFGNMIAWITSILGFHEKTQNW